MQRMSIIPGLLSRCRAWITYSKTLPAKFPFPTRSFVKASFFDGAQTLLVSKSVLYPSLSPVPTWLVLPVKCYLHASVSSS